MTEINNSFNESSLLLRRATIIIKHWSAKNSDFASLLLPLLALVSAAVTVQYESSEERQGAIEEAKKSTYYFDLILTWLRSSLASNKITEQDLSLMVMSVSELIEILKSALNNINI